MNSDVGLFTSGIMDNSSISFNYGKRLRELGLDFCYLSIYSNRPDIHDRMTAHKGSFEKTIGSIQTLASLGISINSNIVIYKDNIHELDEIIAYLSNIGVKHVRLLRLVNHGNASKNWEVVGLDLNSQNSEIMRIISNVSKYPIEITLAGFPDIISCRPYRNVNGCQAGISLIYVTLSGDVYPCASVKTNSRFLIAHLSETERIKDYLENHSTSDAGMTCLNRR